MEEMIKDINLIGELMIKDIVTKEEFLDIKNRIVDHHIEKFEEREGKQNGS